MAEYIKREDVKTAIRERFNSLADRVEINTIVNMMPHIEIVRCRECKYWQTEWISEEGVDDCHYCSMVDRSTFADWYCADGEREGE